MDKYLLNVAVMVILTGLLVACGKPTNPTPTQQKSNNVKKIRIATESQYEPFTYLDSQGNHAGFDIDLIRAICAKIEAKCTIRDDGWQQLLPGLTANKYDAVIANMSITDERLKTVNFSDPYFSNKLVFLGKKGDKDITAINDLSGQNIVVQQGTVSEEYLKSKHPKAKIKLQDKVLDVYLDLRLGRAQYMLGDIGPALQWLSTRHGVEFEVKGTPIDINDQFGIAMRKEDTELAQQINAALAELKASGKYDKIAAKYFDSNIIGTAKQPQ